MHNNYVPTKNKSFFFLERVKKVLYNFVLAKITIFYISLNFYALRVSVCTVYVLLSIVSGFRSEVVAEVLFSLPSFNDKSRKEVGQDKKKKGYRE